MRVPCVQTPNCFLEVIIDGLSTQSRQIFVKSRLYTLLMASLFLVTPPIENKYTFSIATIFEDLFGGKNKLFPKFHSEPATEMSR